MQTYSLNRRRKQPCQEGSVASQIKQHVSVPKKGSWLTSNTHNKWQIGNSDLRIFFQSKCIHFYFVLSILTQRVTHQLNRQISHICFIWKTYTGPMSSLLVIPHSSKLFSDSHLFLVSIFFKMSCKQTQSIRGLPLLQWGFPGGSVVKNQVVIQDTTYNTRDAYLISGSGRSPEEGNGNPLDYSYLRNPMDRGSWWTTFHGVSRVRHDVVTKPPSPSILQYPTARIFYP